MKYLDLLNRTADETAKSNNPLIAESAQLDIMQKTLACKKVLAEKNALLAKLKSSADFKVDEIYACHNVIGLMTRQIAFYEELTKELF